LIEGAVLGCCCRRRRRDGFVSDEANVGVKSEDEASSIGAASDRYVLPLVGVHVPAKLVNVGFWGGLVGAVALGAVDPALGILVGAGVVIARHNTKN
jgi:hypothetical protein